MVVENFQKKPVDRKSLLKTNRSQTTKPKSHKEEFFLFLLLYWLKDYLINLIVFIF